MLLVVLVLVGLSLTGSSTFRRGCGCGSGCGGLLENDASEVADLVLVEVVVVGRSDGLGRGHGAGAQLRRAGEGASVVGGSG